MRNYFYFSRRVCATIFVVVIFCSLPLLAQTNSESTNGPLKLLPPYGELPPTFWEQNAPVISFAGLGAIALAIFVLWLIFRAKPKIIIPPEAQAREALQKLREQPEDGAVLSRISQVLRNYFCAAFHLSPGELTTTEFCREVSNSEKVGAELSNEAADFLRESDARKFSTTAGATKFDAANRALKLVEQAEQRRAQLRQLAETQKKDSRT
jgi:hypothetical protein